MFEMLGDIDVHSLQSVFQPTSYTPIQSLAPCSRISSISLRALQHGKHTSDPCQNTANRWNLNCDSGTRWQGIWISGSTT